jgi:hypothetical protein
MPIGAGAPLNLREIVAASCGPPVHAKGNRELSSNKKVLGRKARRSLYRSA